MRPNGLAAAAPAVPEASTGLTEPELRALMAALEPDWLASASLDASVGYKDNLLLSHSNRAASGFVRGGVESFVSRVPKGAFDVAGLVSAQASRYFENAVVDHDSRAYGTLQFRYRFRDVLALTLEGQGYYFDQLYDVSDTDVVRLVTELKVAGARFGPTLRWYPWSWLWVEGSGTGTRESFHGGLYNATVTDWAARIGVKPTDRIQVIFEGAQRRRAYDRRNRYTATGRPVDGLLVVHERSVDGRVVATIGRSRHWKTTTRVGASEYIDNGSGFLNYRQDRLSQEIEWEAGQWRVDVEGEARRRRYQLQTVGFGIAPPKQIKEDYAATVRIERKLTDHWKCFAEYSWERSRSNDVVASYAVNEGLLGARWSWDK